MAVNLREKIFSSLRKRERTNQEQWEDLVHRVATGEITEREAIVTYDRLGKTEADLHAALDKHDKVEQLRVEASREVALEAAVEAAKAAVLEGEAEQRTMLEELIEHQKSLDALKLEMHAALNRHASASEAKAKLIEETRTPDELQSLAQIKECVQSLRELGPPMRVNHRTPPDGQRKSIQQRIDELHANVKKSQEERLATG